MLWVLSKENSNYKQVSQDKRGRKMEKKEVEEKFKAIVVPEGMECFWMPDAGVVKT